MEYYNVWKDEEYDDLNTLYPLSYFIGHEYRYKYGESSDKETLFPVGYAQTYSDLFDLNDVTKLDQIIRRYYNPYVVRKEYYTINGADIKTYTLANLQDAVNRLTFLHHDEWLVIKQVAEWYNDGAIDKTLVYNFFTKHDGDNWDKETGEVNDNRTTGAEQSNPYTTEKSFGSGADARKTVDHKEGEYRETLTGSRKPNDNGTSWLEQTKQVSDTDYDVGNDYKNTSTESGKEFIKTYGQMVNNLKRTFGTNGHMFDHHIDETLKGYRNRDLVKELPMMFERGGLEWLHLVAAEIVRELVYMVLAI